MTLAIILDLCLGGTCCIVAAGKGRNAPAWLLIGSLAPAVGLIVVVALPGLCVPTSLEHRGPQLDRVAWMHLQRTTMDALERLVRLRERGVITEIELREKRAELLARVRDTSIPGRVESSC